VLGRCVDVNTFTVRCCRCGQSCGPGWADVHHPPGCQPYYTCVLCSINEGVDGSWVEEVLRGFPREHATTKRPVSPYQYQADDARRIARMNRVLIGSEMGTGKTPTAALGAIPPHMGAMIFCPTSVKWNWARELATWRPDLQVELATSRRFWHLPEPGQVVIAGFGLMPGDVCPGCRERGSWACAHREEQANPIPKIDRPVVLLGDEAHYLQNESKRQTQWDELRDEVWRAGGHLVVLTGTVVSNSAEDLPSILERAHLRRAAFGDRETFHRLFSGWLENRKGERSAPWGEERREVLERLRPVRICRLRKHVLRFLPPVQEREVTVELTKETLAEVDEAVQRLLATRRAQNDVKLGLIEAPWARGLSDDERERRKLRWDERVAMYFETRPWTTDAEVRDAVREILKHQHKSPGIFELSRIRAMLSLAKIAVLRELVERNEHQGEPLVVFCQHVAVLERVFDGRVGWGLYTGKVSQKNRDRVWTDFQAGNHQHGIALSITAGGEGINLTRSAFGCFVDRHFNPAKNRQARDRLNRPGAEQHDSITIYDLVADHAVDRLVRETLEEKEALQLSLEDDEASMAGLDPEDVAA
jgi:SNF2 family DNA or RNA helicase